MIYRPFYNSKLLIQNSHIIVTISHTKTFWPQIIGPNIKCFLKACQAFLEFLLLHKEYPNQKVSIAAFLTILLKEIFNISYVLNIHYLRIQLRLFLIYHPCLPIHQPHLDTKPSNQSQRTQDPFKFIKINRFPILSPLLIFSIDT